MTTPEIKVFANLEELSGQAARLFEGLAKSRARPKKIFSVALSGGSTPKRLYEMLAGSRRQIPWDRIHFFQVDERCVPPDHPESNYKMIRAALLDYASIPPLNFHRIVAEDPDRDAAARQYAQDGIVPAHLDLSGIEHCRACGFSGCGSQQGGNVARCTERTATARPAARTRGSARGRTLDLVSGSGGRAPVGTLRITGWIVTGQIPLLSFGFRRTMASHQFFSGGVIADPNCAIYLIR